MKIISLALFVVAACGGAQDRAQSPDVSGYSGDRFASKALCQQAVENVEKQVHLSTTNDKQLFDRAGYDQAHEDRVRKCSITLTEREAACLSQAKSLQYAKNCSRYPELQ
jgi:hypothetical protein